MENDFLLSCSTVKHYYTISIKRSSFTLAILLGASSIINIKYKQKFIANTDMLEMDLREM